MQCVRAGRGVAVTGSLTCQPVCGARGCQPFCSNNLKPRVYFFVPLLLASNAVAGLCLSRLIESVPLFKLFHNAFIRTLVMKLKADVVMKGDIIFNFGQPVPGVYFGEPWEQPSSSASPGPPSLWSFPTAPARAFVTSVSL